MKLLLAILQPPKLEAVRNALHQVGIESMTVCDAQGYARQRGKTPTYRGHEYKANLLRKVVVEILVHDDRLELAIETITEIARSGQDGTIGDGKIFVFPTIDAIRLSDGVRGEEAVG